MAREGPARRAASIGPPVVEPRTLRILESPCHQKRRGLDPLSFLYPS
jgi:hypothetical protein